jgi:hypothetical protein
MLCIVGGAFYPDGRGEGLLRSTIKLAGEKATVDKLELGQISR